MPKYLFKVKYTREGAQGVMKGGGSARRAAAEAAAKSLGGKVESFYFAFGGTDAYVVGELPDNQAAAALALTISATGAVTAETAVLLMPEEIDEATKRSVTYTPPGG